MRIFAGVVAGLAVASVGVVRGGEPGALPLPVPLTRPEMKQALEDLKERKPRIPELSDEEKQQLGERGASYETRLRYHYLPKSDVRSGAWLARDSDPNMSLDYAFKTQLFWIVSRTNNCHY